MQLVEVNINVSMDGIPCKHSWKSRQIEDVRVLSLLCFEVKNYGWGHGKEGGDMTTGWSFNNCIFWEVVDTIYFGYKMGLADDYFNNHQFCTCHFSLPCIISSVDQRLYWHQTKALNRKYATHHFFKENGMKAFLLEQWLPDSSTEAKDRTEI